MTALIGFTGRKGAGKDTAFGFTQEWAGGRGVHAARRGFADLLKLSFARLFHPDMSLTEATWWCDKVKFDGNMELTLRLDDGATALREVTEKIYVSGRAALQRYGTEGHRDVFGENFWVDALLPPENWIRSFTDGPFQEDAPAVCVLTDVRFDNEAQRIRDLGGKVIEIDRGGSGDGHLSEKGISADLVDATIKNDASIEMFRENTYNILDNLFPENQT